MSTLTFVRHGQANTSARDEASYDRLSPLGQQQSEWLGAHFREGQEPFTRVISGTLQRQVDTAIGITGIAPQQDPRLNEMEYFTLAQSALEVHGIPMPDGREEFQSHLPRLLTLWQADALPGAPERFEDFEARVQAVLDDLAAGKGPALIATSGGVIAMTLRLTLGLDVAAMARCCLSIHNSSVHRYVALATGLGLAQFNAVPHLELPERRFALTHL